MVTFSEFEWGLHTQYSWFEWINRLCKATISSKWKLYLSPNVMLVCTKQLRLIRTWDPAFLSEWLEISLTRNLLAPLQKNQTPRSYFLEDLEIELGYMSNCTRHCENELQDGWMVMGRWVWKHGGVILKPQLSTPGPAIMVCVNGRMGSRCNVLCILLGILAGTGEYLIFYSKLRTKIFKKFSSSMMLLQYNLDVNCAICSQQFSYSVHQPPL